MPPFRCLTKERQQCCNIVAVIIVVSVIVVGVSVTIVAWIITSERTDNQQAIDGLQSVLCELECRAGKNCGGEMKRAQPLPSCRTSGNSQYVPLPAVCESNTSVLQYMNDATTSGYTSRKTSSWDRRIQSRRAETGYLGGVLKTFYRPARIIIHWLVMATSSEGDNKWRTVKDFERHRSTYTVSSGPEESFENGVLVIPKSGLYVLYAKLTFACTNVTETEERITMELVLHEGHRPTTLLRGIEDVSCFLTGDVATIYQQGLFRMARGNRVILRFKAPRHVALSTDDYEAFKSNMGAYRVGLV